MCAYTRGTWHLVSILETESSVVDWIVGLSQDLAATSNSKNAFYSFICLACLGRYSLCATTTSSVEEIVQSELKPPHLLAGGIKCPVSPWGLPQPWWHDISWHPWVGG